MLDLIENQERQRQRPDMRTTRGKLWQAANQHGQQTIPFGTSGSTAVERKGSKRTRESSLIVIDSESDPEVPMGSSGAGAFSTTKRCRSATASESTWTKVGTPNGAQRITSCLDSSCTIFRAAMLALFKETWPLTYQYIDMDRVSAWLTYMDHRKGDHHKPHRDGDGIDSRTLFKFIVSCTASGEPSLVGAV